MIYIEQKQVSSIAVCDNQGRILMGKRKDNGKYTLPGGHLEGGDRDIDGAHRELFEEAGIRAHGLTHLTTRVVTKRDGNPITIHAYMCAAEPTDITTENDPDDEVYGWEWIDCRMGLPPKIRTNLHNGDDDVVLRELGMYKSELFIDTASTSKLKVKSSQPVNFVVKAGLEPSLYIEEFDFIFKGGPHKYLRKYRGRDGKWIYVYHEPGQRGRRIPEEAIGKLKKLAEIRGHLQSRQLLDSIEEHPQEKIDALRTLAYRFPDSDSGKRAREMLENLGLEKTLEDKVMPQQPQTTWDEELDPSEAESIADLMSKAVNRKVHGYLSSYSSSPFATALKEEHSVEALKDKLSEQKTIRGLVDTLHEHMASIDEAHKDLGETQNRDARSAGGYGNLGFRAAMDSLNRGNHVHGPTAAKLKDARTPEGLEFDWDEHAETQEQFREEMKEERERQLREEEERREAEAKMAETLSGSMAEFVLKDRSSSEQMRLHEFFTKAFGRNMRAEDWPYDFSSKDVDVKFDRVIVDDDSAKFVMTAYDKDGREITEEWVREWNIKDNGGVQIYNSYLMVKRNQRGRTKLGSLINESQQEFLKKYSPKGEIKVHAALDVGGYNWANQGFKFANDSQLRSYRSEFRSYLKRNGIDLSAEDMEKFTLPCHFSSFDVGVKKTRTINGRDVEVHLGKDFMLGRDWYGVLKVKDMNEQDEGYRFFRNYSQMKDETWQKLEPEYKALVKETRSQPRRETRGSSGSRSGSSGDRTGSSELVGRWVGSNGRIRMSSRRWDQLAEYGWQDLRDMYYSHGTKFSTSARAQLRRLLRERQR